MGVFQRMRDMTRASINELLDKVEDPIVMLNQYLRDMEEEISGAQVAVAQQIANERKIQYRHEEALRNAAKKQAEAEAALKAGQEAAARQLLEQKLYFDERAKEYSALHVDAKNQAEELKRQLHTMKEDFYTMKERRNELVQRAQMAKAKKQIAQAVYTHSTIEGGQAARGFQRMEEKILEMEVDAEVSKSTYAAPGASSMSSRPAAANPQVEDEMNRLRAKLGIAGTPSEEQAVSSEQAAE